MKTIPAKRIKIVFHDEPKSGVDFYIHMTNGMIGHRATGYCVFRDNAVGDAERLGSALNNALGNWGHEADITVEEFVCAPVVAEDLLQALLRANYTLRALGLEQVVIPSELLSLDSNVYG